MSEALLRDQLTALLRGGEAHGEVEPAVSSFPLELAAGESKQITIEVK